MADAAAEAAATAAAVRIATATAAAFAGAGPPAPIPPKRGGIHPMYGVYIGGCPLGDDYLPKKTLSYHFSSQRRHVKTISTIESNLIKARDSTITLKFNGQLEAVVGSATEVGKEKFLVMLKRKIEEHGQETFYHIQSDAKVMDLIEHIHNFTVEQVTEEFNRRLAADASTNEAYDSYELDEITMSRTLVESLVTPEFYEKIFIRYGHQDNFNEVPGSVLVAMALETCNASVSHDIDGAAKAFDELALDTYPGENITNLTTEALRLLKIMQGGYALPVHTGSRLLMKVTKTSSEEFNRKVFALLDPVKEMEYKYKVLDPKSIKADPDYKTYGPIALIATLQQAYGRLISFHDWPALALKLPESNNVSAQDGTDTRKCFRCQGSHLVKDCPVQNADNKKKDKKGDQTNKSKNKVKDADKEKDSDEPAAKKARIGLAAWKYLEPKDLTKPLVEDGKEWKFCTKCKCRKTDKVGIYQLSHFDSEHIDNYSGPNEGNLASVHVPLGIPAATTKDPSKNTDDDGDDDDDDIEFVGAWCAPVFSFADPDLTPDNFSPHHDYPSSDESGVGVWCAPVSVADVTFVVNPVEREILVDDPANFDHIDPFLVWMGCKCDPIMTCVECDTDWQEHLADYLEFIKPPPLWPPSKELLSEKTLAFLRTAEAVVCSNDHFESSIEYFQSPFSADSVPVEYEGSLFYDTEPVEGVFTRENAHTLVSFLGLRPKPLGWLHDFMILVFWWTTMFWDLVTYLVVGDGSCPKPYLGSRSDYRRLTRYQRGRHRSPLLRFLPMAWMILSNTVRTSHDWRTGLGNVSMSLPTQERSEQLFRHFTDVTFLRVKDMDDKVVLNMDTLVQYNQIKFDELLNGMAELNMLTVKADATETDDVLGTLQTDEFFDTLQDEPPMESQVDCHFDAQESQYFFDAISIAQTQYDPFDIPGICANITAVTCVNDDMSCEDHLKELLKMQDSLFNEESSVSINGPITSDDEISVHQAFGQACAFMTFGADPNKKPIIFDTGASLAITPDEKDFNGPLSVPSGDLRLGGMANGLRIAGMGTVTWTFTNPDGTEVQITGQAYHVPGAKARLLSPQRLFDNTKTTGCYEGDATSFRLKIDGCHPLVIDYDDRNSLPIGYATIGPKVEVQANIALVDEANQNLTAGQKLLLHWHYRFGHMNLPAVQRILRAVPFLSAQFESASKCDMRSIKCAICEFAKGHRRAIRSVVHVPKDEHVGALKVDHLKPGAQVSVDHFESRLLGRTFDSYGKATSDTFKGGCIFVDHSSGYMHVEHQIGFSAVETVRAKHHFEALALAHGVVIESYLTDSGAFKANAFVQHINNHGQRIRYCGANAHHKNGVAERAVMSVSNMARAMLLHSSAHWKNGINAALWPMAVKYATHQYNHLPNAQGLCPADHFSGSTVPRHRLRDIHVWGCPVYVLDPHLQAGKKLPRWQPRSRRGVFVGFSSLHSSEVPLVLNLQTGSITPQYHVVFDDHFSTVTSVEREMDPPDHWAELCLENATYIPTDPTDVGANGESTAMFLDDDWLTPEELDVKVRSGHRQTTIRDTFEPEAAPTLPSASVPSATPSLPTADDAPDLIAEPPIVHARVTQREQRAVQREQREQRVTQREQSTAPLSTTASAPKEPLPSSTAALPSLSSPIGVRRSSRSTKGVFKNPRYIDEVYLNSMHTMSDPGAHQAQLAYLAELLTCPDSGILDITDPRVYATKVRGKDADTPTYQQAMNGPDAAEYLQAMQLEIHTLIGQRTWKYIDRSSVPKGQNVLKGTWAFKLKRLPDGTAYRHKARFCARGDMQKEGVDFFETYAPVVQWSTIRLLLSTVLTEGWTTRQVDYTNAFAQAEIKEEVYVEYPRLFGSSSGKDRVLHLRKSLYGLRQAPRTFFEKLKSGLEERGWIQSVVDPCLFLKKGMMCVVYVDDTIFASKHQSDLDVEIKALGISTKEQQHSFALRDEGEVSAFLGIQIKKTGPNEFLLTQTGLIDKVLEVTKMSHCNGCDTPATVDPLHADKDGPPFKEDWQYDAVIGMLMYLAGNTRPDIAYAVHQAARFTHGTRNSHAAGIKRILRYLQKTRTEGLWLRPQDHLQVDCYVDADFGGLFSVEDKQDPISVKSRTGYVILYRGAPLLWVSKMQTQIALSTMEAEYIALSQSMRDLIPIREILKEIMTIVFDRDHDVVYRSHSKAFDDVTSGLVKHNIPQSTVYEDNDACLKFARMPKLTPRTKHIGVPYHWFRTQVENLEIHIERIDTTKQLGDQFTKGLTVDLFRTARKSLMGW